MSFTPSPDIASNLVLEIRSTLEDMRPSERKVAELVLNDVDFAIHASITDLALHAGVSEPSVTRFCRAIGCTGIKEFKIQLAQSIATGISYTSTTVLPSDNVNTLLEKVSTATQEGLEQLKQLDPQMVEAAIEALSKAKRIFFIGVGSGSGIVAQDAYLRFLRLELSANALTDGHLQRLYCGLLEPGDVAFGISNSGRTPEIYQSLQIARQRGATTIALTHRRSKLAELADIPILLSLPSTVDAHTPGVSRMVHLCIMDALAMGVALKLPDSTHNKIRHAKAQLNHQVDYAFQAHLLDPTLFPKPNK